MLMMMRRRHLLYPLWQGHQRSRRPSLSRLPSPPYLRTVLWSPVHRHCPPVLCLSLNEEKNDAIILLFLVIVRAPDRISRLLMSNIAASPRADCCIILGRASATWGRDLRLWPPPWPPGLLALAGASRASRDSVLCLPPPPTYLRT